MLLAPVTNVDSCEPVDPGYVLWYTNKSGAEVASPYPDCRVLFLNAKDAAIWETYTNGIASVAEWLENQKQKALNDLNSRLRHERNQTQALLNALGYGSCSGGTIDDFIDCIKAELSSFSLTTTYFGVGVVMKDFWTNITQALDYYDDRIDLLQRQAEWANRLWEIHRDEELGNLEDFPQILPMPME